MKLAIITLAALIAASTLYSYCRIECLNLEIRQLHAEMGTVVVHVARGMPSAGRPPASTLPDSNAAEAAADE